MSLSFVRLGCVSPVLNNQGTDQGTKKPVAKNALNHSPLLAVLPATPAAKPLQAVPVEVLQQRLPHPVRFGNTATPTSSPTAASSTTPAGEATSPVQPGADPEQGDVPDLTFEQLARLSQSRELSPGQWLLLQSDTWM